MSDSPVAIIYDSAGNEKGVVGNPVKTDPTGTTTQPVSGTVTANAGTGPFPVSDNGGSLTVDGPLTDTQLRATAVPVSASFSPADKTSSGTITALNGTVTIDTEGCGVVVVQILGTWVGTLVSEATVDGTNWFALAGYIVPGDRAAVTQTTINGTFRAICVGFKQCRVRASAWTSGTALADARASQASAISRAGIIQDVQASWFNDSTTNLAAWASFTGGAESTLGVAGIQVCVASDQPIAIQMQQSQNGTDWDISDEQTFLTGEGDGRTFQAVSSFFRVIATNQGNATTTYFRLQTALCPVVEALPRSLTPHGKLQIASMTTGWAPDPSNAHSHSDHRALLMDTDRNLNVRARVLTDEASFRDDFTTGELYVELTGTVYFTNGSTIVTGVGTLFATELNKQHHLKLSGHADSVYAAILVIESDTYLELSEPYTGATGSGTCRSSYWLYSTGSGAAITQTGSEILLASGTTSGTEVSAIRPGDYPPYVIGFKARITQRIANQESHLGLADGVWGAIENQALVVFDGTTNTTVKLRTSSSSADVETTTVTLPDGAVSSTGLYYQLEVTSSKVTLFINDVKVAEHKLHIPDPYAAMDCVSRIKNTDTAGSTTTLAFDTFFMVNFDRVEVSNAPKGDPLAVKELRASVATSSNVSAAVADTQLLAPNANRLSYSIFNDSVAILYLKHGSGASATSFKVALSRYDYYEFTGYVGRVNGYWSAATGAARVSEES